MKDAADHVARNSWKEEGTLAAFYRGYATGMLEARRMLTNETALDLSTMMSGISNPRPDLSTGPKPEDEQ